MFLNHDSTRERLNARQREALERRNRMTQRRQELTSKIRKQKKSKYLQKKRNLPCTSTTVSSANHTATTAEFRSLFNSYCQNSASLEQLLLALQGFASSPKPNAIGRFSPYGSQHSNNPLVILEQTDEDLAIKFLDNVRRQTVEAISKQETIPFQTALQILVHLTSITSSDGVGSSASDYYGRQPSSWSELIASPALSLQPSASYVPSWMEILTEALSSSNEVELTSLVLGNLVGDDKAAATIFRNVSNEFKASLVTGLIRSVSPATPTAAWTLTNMIRNDPVSYASSYCSDRLLSTSVLMDWLGQPSLATQTAWMIASLTAREEEAVNYLCGKQQQQQHDNQERKFLFLSTILESIQNPLQPDQRVPLVQALGNLACHPSLVAPLLTITPNLVPILQTILSTSSSRDPILLQGAWLAGCLLVDVGVTHHPSTTVAAPALIPLMMERLGRGTENGQMGSQTMTSMTLEEEREFASALWNALENPPGGNEHEPQVQPNHFLRPPSFELPFQLNVPSSTIRSLVRLINSNDSDAAVAAINLVDLLLRRFDEHQNFQAVMQEEGLPDALDRICDSPMHHASEIAAEILDDYFYNDNNAHDDMESSEIFWTTGQPVSTVPAFGMNAESRAASGMGRGRGRGAMMPAWMTK